jgi:hypothetical protein
MGFWTPEQVPVQVPAQMARQAQYVAGALAAAIRYDPVLHTAGGPGGLRVPDTAIAGMAAAKLTGAVRADTNGNALLGTGALAAGATNGFAYIPLVAAAPVGVPAAQTGYAPLAFVAATMTLYAWDGAAWRSSVFV